jgi:hypothetical protein
MNMKHGHTGRGWKSPTYYSWQCMKQRCSNPNDPNYHFYGGRGITFCDRWDTFANFLSDMRERMAGCNLDRIDVNGNYEPSNCRWLPVSEQNNNTRRKRIENFTTEQLMCELGRRGEFVF